MSLFKKRRNIYFFNELFRNKIVDGENSKKELINKYYLTEEQAEKIIIECNKLNELCIGNYTVHDLMRVINDFDDFCKANEKTQCMSCEKKIPKNEAFVFCEQCIK